MDRIDVSPEMVTFIGRGCPTGALPADPIAFAIRLDANPVLAFTGPGEATGADVLCIVARDACRRIFGQLPDAPASFHLSSELRGVALAIRDCDLPHEARTTLRLAKSIELLCGVFAALTDGALVPADREGALSESDTRRIVVARRMIDENWRDKLTLDAIARACCINRTKLTRGFRATFGMTVADAIAERRLGGARELLLSTDLPVSSVGYACGYLNNASFTRAFARRYGVVPTRLRAQGMAA